MTIDVSQYGVSVLASSGINSEGIQAAINEVGVNGGGTVVITSPGIYNLSESGVNPYRPGGRYCVDLKYDNIEFIISSGVILRLDEDQQKDLLGPVDLFIFKDRKNLTIQVNGEIDGNAGNQPNWTISGAIAAGSMDTLVDSGRYGQIQCGVIIRGFSSENENIKIFGNGILRNHFSNPVNIQGGKNVEISGLRGENCGEGFQLISVDGAKIFDCHYSDPADVAVGDAFEFASCDNFFCRGCSVRSNGTGSAFDLFGSQKGILTDFLVDGWKSGVDMKTTSQGRIADQIQVNNGIMRNCFASDGTVFSGEGRIHFNNLLIENSSGVGIYVSGTNQMPRVNINSCSIVSPNLDGIFVLGPRSVSIHNCVTRGSVAKSGVRFQKWIGVEVPDFVITGLVSTNNARLGIEFDGQGASFVPTGLISSCSLTNNTLRPIDWTNFATPTDSSGKGVRVIGLNPIQATSSAKISGHSELSFIGGADITSLGVGSLGQTLTILFTGNRIIKDVSGGGNVRFQGGVDFAGSAGNSVSLLWNSSSGQWLEVSRFV